MTPAASRAHSLESSIAAAQYETLRTAGLGGALPLEARSGLILFRRRGMWGWARALADASAPKQPIRSAPMTPIAPYEHRTIIHVFAAMAMNTNNRRAP